MLYITQLLTVAGVVLLGAMSPGPDFIAVSSNALRSRRAGILSAFGIAAGAMIWALLAVFGLGVLLSRLNWLYSVIRFLGVGYLVFLGCKMLLSARHPGVPLKVLRSSGDQWGAFRRAFLVNMTNPKVAVFFGSLFVTILPVAAPIWVYAMTIAIVGGVATCWFVIIAVMFSTDRVRALYERIRRPIDVLMGAALVGLAAKLASSR